MDGILLDYSWCLSSLLNQALEAQDESVCKFSFFYIWRTRSRCTCLGKAIWSTGVPSYLWPFVDRTFKDSQELSPGWTKQRRQQGKILPALLSLQKEALGPWFLAPSQPHCSSRAISLALLRACKQIVDGKGAQMSGENTDGFHEASVLRTHGKRRVENDVSVLSSCASASVHECGQVPSWFS